MIENLSIYFTLAIHDKRSSILLSLLLNLHYSGVHFVATTTQACILLIQGVFFRFLSSSMSSESSSRSLRVGVSGATGFIGLELIRQLLQCDDVSVHAIVLKSSANIIPLENVLSKPGTVESYFVRTADITDEDSARNAIRGLDAIVHIAGVLDGFVCADKNHAEELNFKMEKGIINGALKEAKQSAKKILFIHVPPPKFTDLCR